MTEISFSPRPALPQIGPSYAHIPGKNVMFRTVSVLEAKPRRSMMNKCYQRFSKAITAFSRIGYPPQLLNWPSDPRSAALIHGVVDTSEQVVDPAL